MQFVQLITIQPPANQNGLFAASCFFVRTFGQYC